MKKLTEKPSRVAQRTRREFTRQIPYTVAVFGVWCIWWLSYLPDPLIYVVCRVVNRVIYRVKRLRL